MSYERTEAEWLDVCDGIMAGHCSPGDNSGPRGTYWEAKAMKPLILVPPKPGDRVLDLGCGNGRLAMALVVHGFTNIHYVGIDPVAESVEFCRRAFAPWPQFEFWHAELKTPTYTPKQAIDPLSWSFPFADGSLDWAAAVSVFTHLQTGELACHYALEFARVLKPGGVLWSTWFASPPNVATSIAERTVYERWLILLMLQAYGGFSLEKQWGGETTATHDQWNLFSRKR